MNKKILRTLFFISLIPLIGLANTNPVKGKYEKSKTIKKEFNVNEDALLKINNKYGNLDIISWNENRIVIEVKITVNGNSEEKVISRLDKIDVVFNASSSEVSAKTTIEKSSSGWFGNNNNMNYQIDYKVKMPVTNDANLVNDYGTITLNELKGLANINCDYGKILIGSLFHENNKINMDYTSNSEIEFMNSGTINADYSKLRVEKAKSIKLNADYTNTVFGNIEDLNFNCDYGKIEVERGNNIIGNGDYLTMRFGEIYKNLKVDSDYGGIRVAKLMNGFESVRINTDYTHIKIGLDRDISFNFTVKLSYGGFDIDSENVNYNKKIIKSSSKYYEGYVNKENSSSTIDINSEYGSIKLFNN
jgi:hypothetical protein